MVLAICFGRPFGIAAARRNRCPHVVGRVESVPSRPVSLLPFGVRHLAVMRDTVVEVVLVDVRVHPHPLLQQGPMVLGSGQGREEEELQNVERQFVLDDLDVAQDRCFRVGWEAEDVAGIGHGAVGAPLLQHGAVFGDLVLSLLGGDQVFRVDVLKADKHPLDAGLGRLLDEVRDLVAERVDLDGEADPDFLVLQGDHPVEQDLPVGVAGEVVVGDEEPVDALLPVRPDDLLEVVGRAEAALAALHVNDGAERALVGAAAAEVDAGIGAGGSFDMLARQNRRGFAFQRGQLIHVVVEGLEFAPPGVEEDLVEPALLRFPGEQRNAERLRLLEFGGHFRKHGDAARNVKAADADRNPLGSEFSGYVERARILVGLHADDADQRPAATQGEVADDPRGQDAPVGLVVGLDRKIDVRPKDFAMARVFSETIHASERVRRQRGAEPLNGIAPVVVMGRLDQDEGEAATAR